MDVRAIAFHVLFPPRRHRRFQTVRNSLKRLQLARKKANFWKRSQSRKQAMLLLLMMTAVLKFHVPRPRSAWAFERLCSVVSFLSY